MFAQLPAAGSDLFEVIDLFLYALGVALGKLFVSPCGGLGLACSAVLARWGAARAAAGHDVPFLTSLALSALRWACTGLKLRSLPMVQAGDGGRTAGNANAEFWGRSSMLGYGNEASLDEVAEVKLGE